MSQNIYDDETFYNIYAKLPRSNKGYEFTYEWPYIKSLLPNIKNSKVLDIGCGYGWFCREAVNMGCDKVWGFDVSKKMLKRAYEFDNSESSKIDTSKIIYINQDLENANFKECEVIDFKNTIKETLNKEKSNENTINSTNEPAPPSTPCNDSPPLTPNSDNQMKIDQVDSLKNSNGNGDLLKNNVSNLSNININKLDEDHIYGYSFQQPHPLQFQENQEQQNENTINITYENYNNNNNNNNSNNNDNNNDNNNNDNNNYNNNNTMIIKNIVSDQEKLENNDNSNDGGNNLLKFDFALGVFIFHYIKNIEDLLSKIFQSLNDGGSLVFSVEHPIYTASKYRGYGWIPLRSSSPDNHCGEELVWPVSHYSYEGERTRTWFGVEGIKKQHRTIGTYINLLVKIGFTIDHVNEWSPNDNQIRDFQLLARERERPIILIIKAIKNIKK